MNKVLFWDFDGTLSSPNKSFETVIADALRSLGLSISESQADLLFSGNVYPWKTPLEDHFNEQGEQWWEALYKRIDGVCVGAGISTDLERLHIRCREMLVDVNNYCLYDDTLSTLEQCRAMGYRNFLLTNNYPEIVDNLKKLGIHHCFEDFIASSFVGYDKPRQELYQYALQLAGNPDIGYMIGDNPVADIGGGKAAGLKTVFVHNGYIPGADHCVDRLEEILDIIK